MHQYTVINGVKSDFESVKYDVPQGSVLGPLFFLLYIYDIYRAIDCNAVILFADDASLIIGNQDLKKKKRTKCSQNYLDANKLSINKEKNFFIPK